MTTSAEPPRDRLYLLSAVLCIALLALPFLLVTLPPITDLPQQVAQMRLLDEALANPGSPYRIQWSDPNKLGYLPLVAAWRLADPLAAGRLGLLVIGVLWVTALHALARDFGRHPAAAAAASILFFNHVTYWGFLNFLIGLPAFVLWLLVLRRLPRASPAVLDGGRPLLLLGSAALLTSAHVLWLAAGLLCLLAAGVLGRWPLRVWILRSLGVLPVLAMVALWYPAFAVAFDSRTTWGHSLLQRLHPGWILNSVFGGLQGNVEAAILVLLAAWLGLGLWQSRGAQDEGEAGEPSAPEQVPGDRGAADRGAADRGAADRPDRLLASVGLFFLAAALALPSVHQHTIFFASRWLPVAAVFFCLACPPPRLRPILRLACPLLLLAALSLATVAAWLEFEVDELAGLPEALAHLPPEPRVLGLDFAHTSERIRGFPYYHLYAYAQALHGGELNRTFANEASSLVVYDDLPRPTPWTDGLDWEARKVRRSDVAYFDYVLVHGTPDYQALFLGDERLVPVTGLEGGKRWRLYRFVGDSAEIP